MTITMIVYDGHFIKNLFPLQQRLLLAILDACGSIFIENSLDKLERKINKNDVLHENFKQRLTHLLIVLKAALPFLIHLHHAVFYWNGSYYNIVKRILGIRYVSMSTNLGQLFLWLSNFS